MSLKDRFPLRAPIDFIADIHGHADILEDLLRELGYDRDARGWHHPEPHRRVSFLGDLIDRGDQQLETLAIVRGMVERGCADVSMGNHELNAIGWATPHPSGKGYLRIHGSRNRAQHQAFLDAVGEGSPQHKEIISWFKAFPLWREHRFRIDGRYVGLNTVHACWNRWAMRRLRPWLDSRRRLTEDGFVAAMSKGTDAFTACEILVKGQEMPLPEGVSYQDKDGITRLRTRVRWWQAGPVSWRQAALVDDEIRDQLPDVPVSGPELHGYRERFPCLVGHYWMNGQPRPLTEKLACLDYSAGKGGALCAYTWEGEDCLRPDHFTWVGPRVERLVEPLSDPSMGTRWSA